jgi:membrane protein involved in colicin uptake
MRFMKFTSAVVLCAGSIALHAQTTTTCTPTWGGGQTCTTQESPLQKLQEQQREQQEQWHRQQQEQQQAFQNQRQQEQANRPQCTTYSRDPFSGQVKARTAPCAF